MSHEYEGVRRIQYGDPTGGGPGDGAIFVPVCTCGRFVKADKSIRFNESGPEKPNASCSKCGRVDMLFEGYL